MGGEVAGSPTPRRRVLVVLAIVAIAIVPAAIAWACNPQAHIRLDRSSYEPGQSVVVSGVYFRGNEAVTVTMSSGGSAPATTSPGGAFRVTMTAPSSPGAYSVYASHSGARAVASFSVAQPAQAAPAPEGVSTPPAAPPSEGQRQTPGSNDTAVTRSRGETTSARGGSDGPSGGSGGGSGSGPGGPGSTPSTGVVTSPSGATFFAGSAPAAPAATTFATPAGERESGRPARDRDGGARVPEGAAVADAWSGAVPGRTPTLTNGVADVADGGAGSQLGIGIALLALAAVALTAGLALATVRRGRVTSR